MSCIVTGGLDFYWKMGIKTVIPPAIVLLLFLWPLSCILRCKPYLPAARTVGFVTLFGIEIMTPSVATTALQTFACSEFDGGWYLRTELTLACDSSVRRARWVGYAIFCSGVYLVGECLPALSV